MKARLVLPSFYIMKLIIYFFQRQVLENGLNIEVLLMTIADTKPKTLHLKPEHHVLLSTQSIPSNFSHNDFASVECIVVHGDINLATVDKERLNSIFPHLQTHTVLTGEYYEYFKSNETIVLEKDQLTELNRRDSRASITSSSSSSSSDFHSVHSSH